MYDTVTLIGSVAGWSANKLSLLVSDWKANKKLEIDGARYFCVFHSTCAAGYIASFSTSKECIRKSHLLTFVPQKLISLRLHWTLTVRVPYTVPRAGLSNIETGTLNYSTTLYVMQFERNWYWWNNTVGVCELLTFRQNHCSWSIMNVFSI